MLAITTMEQAREKIKALGFSDQDRGTLVAILLALPPADRFLVFEDVDAVVTASLQAMLRQNNPPQPQQPPQPPQLQQQQQQQQFQQLQPPLVPIPQQQQQQQQPPPQGFFNTIGNMFGFSNAAPPMHQSFAPQQQRGIMSNRPPVNQFSDVVFDDDQAPIEQPPAYEAVQSVQTAETTLSLKTKTLVPAVEFGSATQTLSMITIKSPALASDAPRAAVALDLVAVLDISGSMSGSKIELMKQAVQFVIRELTDKDRLCLIVFHSTGEKLCPLTVMNEEGKNKLLFIVDRITSRGSTMIGDGLRLAIQTLQKRRYPNNVPSILLLSDGQDDRPDEVRALEIPFVTHTFGFGADHDAALLGLIAQKTHGSFTFVEKFDLIAESFATCVGGLTSIFAQKINLKVEMQGPYQFLKWHTRFAAEIAPDKKSATLSITDIYSEESRDIIFEIDVPKLPAPVEADKLFSVGCTYVKVAQNPENVTLPLVHQNLARPQALPAGMTRDFELDKQWNRIMTASAMENAPKLCQDGKFNDAQDVIKKTIASIEQSVSGNDPTCKALVEDLKTCASRLVDRTTYETSGKAFAMQQQQSHWGQRATYSPMAAPNAYSNVQSSQWAEKAKVSKKGF